MKTKILLTLAAIAMLFACKKDETVSDPIFEFVFFKGNSSVNVNEGTNSTVAYPVVAQVYAFKPYSQDIELTLEVIGTNAQAGVDFTVDPATTLKIKAGSLISDTLWIKTIDNDVSSSVSRTFVVRIKSTSQSDLKVGLGISDPQKDAITFNIIDDECSAQTTIFNTTLNDAVDWGGGDIMKTATGTLNGDSLTVKGNLIDYSAFSNATLTMALTPAKPGATKGAATFGEQQTGTDSDGYEYKFIQTGTGSFDLCAGTVTVNYDIYYLDGSSWTYWYSVKNTFSLP